MAPEITKIEDQTPKITSHFVWIFFGCLTVFVYFFGLDIPLLGPDEPRYAQIAREMLERSDWITPTLGGFNWFEKPPVLYWLEMISYKLFGVSEFAARLGPAFFGISTIASLWILGRFIERTNSNEQRSIHGFANWLALIAASTLGIVTFSHAASFDIVITFPMTAALVGFFIFDQSRTNGISAPLILFYIFIGIALLAKGLIGILFPFAIVAMYFLLARRLPNRTFVLSLIWGTLLAAAIASMWYLPMYQRHGNQFVDEFIIQHHFQRFTSNKYQHPQPFYFFFWVLPLMTLPWLPFFLVSFLNLYKSIFQKKAAEITFSFAWLIVPLLFFSFSGSKLPGYILPTLPAMIVLTSTYVFEITSNSNKWRKAILLIATSTFALTVLLLIFAVPRFAESDSVKTLIQTAKERGHSSERVLTLHTISHNAEFYAAGRLLRDSQGRQLRLSGVGEVLNEIAAEDGHTVLVLVPLEYLSQLTTNEQLVTEVLKDNGELAIAAVSAK